MSLLELWKNSPEQIHDKQIHQLIAFAGNGQLKDENDCSKEFRSFLASVPSRNLVDYSEQCLSQSFTDSGFALQDVVNEIGSRLGAVVVPGRYRGTRGANGLDGLWNFPNGHSIVIEVKTTDAYRIDLNTIAQYRQLLIEDKTITASDSSMLLVVGRQDTGDLEAQIRGSRFAWDVRIISVDALVRLMSIKEEVDDPASIQRIHNILIPREFTRLDEIAEVLFSAAEDIKSDTVAEDIDEDSPGTSKEKEPKFTPVAFHEACIERVKKKLSVNLIKRSRSTYSDPENSIAVTCSVSKEHDPNTKPNYWYAFHPHQKEFLEKAKQSYVVFGCGSSKQVILIPLSVFEEWLDGTWVTTKNDQFYWHILIYRNQDRFILHRKKGQKKIDVTKYML